MLATLALGLALAAGQAAPPPKTIAIFPLHFTEGTETAQETARNTLVKAFEAKGYEVINHSVAVNTWANKIQIPVSHTLPTSRKLLAYGKMLNADYVCAASFKWHTRSIWIGAGPKTKATCWVTLRMINVKQAHIVLDRKNVEADDNEVDSTLEAAVSVLILPITVVSGGPMTPRQERAAQIAIGKALNPLFQQKKIKTRRIR